jgi:O-antigen ligase
MNRRSLLEASRWLLLITLVAASWLWGGTRPWTQAVIAHMLLIDSGIFLLGLVILGRFPRIPRITLGAVMLILTMGWLISLNSYPGPGGIRILLPKIQGIHVGWPAFLDRNLSLHAMLLVSGLLGAFCIACDLSANREWRMFFWKAIALNGFGIVILGLAQRFTNAPSIYWNVYEYTGPTFFAVYRYHANAGSFMNLVIPLLVALAVLSVMQKWWQAERVLWITGALLSCAAAFINASRAANVIAIFLLLIGAGWVILIALRSRRSPLNGRNLVILMAAVVMLLVVLIQSFGTEMTSNRWRSFQGLAWNHDRMLTYRVICGHLLPKTGIFGVGPGNFEGAFAAVVEARDLPVRGRWDLAHNDYLQALVEWGWVGFICWIIVIGGGFLNALRIAWSRDSSLDSKALGIAGTLALGGVLLHAAIDFPLQIPSIQLCVVLICGLSYGHPVEGIVRKRKSFRKAEPLPIQ